MDPCWGLAIIRTGLQRGLVRGIELLMLNYQIYCDQRVHTLGRKLVFTPKHVCFFILWLGDSFLCRVWGILFSVLLEFVSTVVTVEHNHPGRVQFGSLVLMEHNV